jgi:hypothetical protein
MKQFDQRRLTRPQEVERQGPRPGRADRAGAREAVLELAHRQGQQLPVWLAELRGNSPARYREVLLSLDLGPVGARRLDMQIELLAGAPDHDIGAELRRRRAASEPLHSGLRARAERSLGVGLSHVRVFHGLEADRAARRYGAAAFAWGHSIVLGAGVRNLPSEVMAEEVAHVAQQRGAGPGRSVTSASSPVEVAARRAAPAILSGRKAQVGRVGRRAVMRVERDGVSPEVRNPRDLAPQFGSMESRSDAELSALVNDEKGRPRYKKRGYLYEPSNAGSVGLELFMAALDETNKRKKGPRGKADTPGSGEAHRVQGEPYAPDTAKPVQRKEAAGAGHGVQVHRAARAGVRGGGAPIPYLRQIQRSFGRHDLSAVRAHVGGSAVLAAQRIGARAYAIGEDVAFAGAPDLQLAAHEAAHVVQQRRGVSVAGGVGAAGDRYEEHADRVAAAVVSGRSAERLLDQMGGHRSASSAVQRTEGGGTATAVEGKNAAKLPSFKFGGKHWDQVTVGMALEREWQLGGDEEPHKLVDLPRARIPIPSLPGAQLFAGAGATLQKKALAAVSVAVGHELGSSVVSLTGTATAALNGALSGYVEGGLMADALLASANAGIRGTLTAEADASTKKAIAIKVPIVTEGNESPDISDTAAEWTAFAVELKAALHFTGSIVASGELLGFESDTYKWDFTKFENLIELVGFKFELLLKFGKDGIEFDLGKVEAGKVKFNSPFLKPEGAKLLIPGIKVDAPSDLTPCNSSWGPSAQRWRGKTVATRSSRFTRR